LNLKLTQGEISQTIDLSDYIGDLADDPSIREAIAQDIIDHIVDRAKNGKSINNQNLKKYDKDYVSSTTFKAYDKSPGEINMTLTGQMLDSVGVIESFGPMIKIGIDDPDQAPKAYNHQVGDTLPKREWFGVRDKEIEEIVASYIEEYGETKKVYDASEIFAAMQQVENADFDFSQVFEDFDG